MQTFVKVISRRIHITMTAIVLAFLLFFGLSETISYSVNKNRTQEFASALLERGTLVMNEIKSIESKGDAFELYPPCSPPFLRSLRTTLWSYSLIKDIGWVQDNMMMCTAMWDRVDPPLTMNLYQKKMTLGQSTWILNAALNENITGDIVTYKNYAIILSPFIFTQFVSHALSQNLSAIIENRSRTAAFFQIGNNTQQLESSQQHPSAFWGFISWRTCAKDYDICVTTGGKPDGLLYESRAMMVVLVITSVTVGLLISIIISLYLDKKRSLSARLLDAITKNKLHLVYQPIYNLKTNAIIGVEALLRWKDPDIGFISPDVFIPIAEKQGMMESLTQLVTRKAIQETQELALDNALFISINISSLDLCSPTYLPFLQNITRETRFPAERLILEITERQGANTNALKEMVEKFKQAGFNIALDDFGTGYSNLNWLSHLSIDEIKIDKSITDSIATESLNKVLLPNLISLLKNMHPKVVFEGIEKKEQVDYLIQNFPDALGQGWFFSKACELPDLKRMISAPLHSSS